MTLRCPVCRAENATGPACRRCRADLSLLIAVEARRDFHVTRAHAALRAGQLETAGAELDRAEEVRPGPDTRRIRACLALLAGDFPAAQAGHGRASATASG